MLHLIVMCRLCRIYAYLCVRFSASGLTFARYDADSVNADSVDALTLGDNKYLIKEVIDYWGI